MRRQASAAEGRIATHGGKGAVGIEVAHVDAPVALGREDDQAVGPHPGLPGTHRRDAAGRPIGESGHTAVEQDEIVARPGHLIEALQGDSP